MPPSRPICDWQTGLCPLNVGKVAVGDALDCLSFKSASNLVKEVWEADGEHRSIWSTLDALQDDLRKIRAS